MPYCIALLEVFRWGEQSTAWSACPPAGAACLDHSVFDPHPTALPLRLQGPRCTRRPAEGAPDVAG